jgi:hypothetical protein
VRAEDIGSAPKYVMKITKSEQSNETEAPISLDRARRYYLESTSATASNDAECRVDANYYHNKQLSAHVKSKLKDRGQPEVFVNKISPAINGIFGIVDASQTDPKCEPRSPEQQDTADLATKVLRYLNDAANMKRVTATSSKDFFLYGTAAVIVGDGANNDNIPIQNIHWEDFFADPTSREHDFSDADYMGISKMFAAEQVKKLYPKAYSKLGDPTDSGADLLSDKSARDTEIWLDKGTKRLRVVELYYKDEACEWQRIVYCHAGILDFGPSAYKDDKGNGLCPIIAASFEVDRQTGDRYGPIRAMRPLQDEYNSRRSSLLNEMQNRRIRQVVQEIDPKSKELARREAPKANGALPYGWDMISVPDIASGQAMLLEKTQQDLDRLAPTPAVLGRLGGGDSGRKAQILQQAGYTEWARAFAHLSDLEERSNRHLWFAAKQFMNMPRWIRVTGEERAPEWIQINQTIGQKPQLAIDEATGQPKLDEAGQPVIEMVPIKDKAIAEMDVDIILETVPDTVTIQAEANEQILRYAEGLGISPMDYQFRMVMELFLTVDKTRALERWDAAFEKGQQQNAQAQQMQMQMQEMQQQLEAMKVQTKAQKDTAQARKADAEADQTIIENDLARRGATMFDALPPTFPSNQFPPAH